MLGSEAKVKASSSGGRVAGGRCAMSAALVLPTLHASATASADWLDPPEGPATRKPHVLPRKLSLPEPPGAAPLTSLAFYRKHTEKMLRRYLYASVLVGRAPNILNEPLSRGWASSRPIVTFEDAIIFVFDVENCLAKLGPLDRLILARAIIQEYSHEEVALLLRVGVRTLEDRLNLALDRLTRIMLDSGLLMLPA